MSHHAFSTYENAVVVTKPASDGTVCFHNSLPWFPVLNNVPLRGEKREREETVKCQLPGNKITNRFNSFRSVTAVVPLEGWRYKEWSKNCLKYIFYRIKKNSRNVKIMIQYVYL
jgi:hypothetical protein